jgi:APA family basic amino acid/polyamine antiporter
MHHEPTQTRVSELPYSATRDAGAQLARVLGPVEATTIVLGGIIGSGIFLAPTIVARVAGAPGLSFAVWIISGLLATCGALCFAELSGAIPETGGTYVFLRRTYEHPLISFLFGWTMFFAISTCAIAAVGTAFASYAEFFLGRIMPYGPWTLRWVAAACILFLTTMNCIGARVGGWIQNLFTFVKVASLAALIGAGLLFGHGNLHNFEPLLPVGKSGAGVLAALGTAMIPTLFAYQGWNYSTYIAGEISNPRRNVPLSIFVGMGTVLMIYLLVNFVYIYVLPFERLQASRVIAADTMQVIVGPMGAGLISLAVILSTFGTVNAQLLSYPRIQYAMSRDALFFRWVAWVHPRFKTPTFAILAQGILAAAFALSGTYDQILSYVSFDEYLFLTLAVAGLIILRHKAPELRRPYMVWGYPFTPLLFIVVCLWYLTNAVTYRFKETMVGVILLLSGLPFYFYWSRRKNRLMQS